MTPISTLSYQGSSIRLRGTMLNLTDMWRAAGSPESRRPTSWLILEETTRFRAHTRAHWTELDEPAGDNVLQGDIIRLDPDGLVATLRGRHGGTWAHWQLALAYARYLSPEFHLWCNTVVRRAMERGGPPAAEHDPLLAHLAEQFRDLRDRLDSLERHAADLMFLVLSAQEIMLSKRLEFTPLTKVTIVKVTAAKPFKGQCPCCMGKRVLTRAGRVVPGAEFDHFFHRSLNKAEHGWLICPACHAELTYGGGYLVRFMRVPEFRTFQVRVVEQRRRERAAPDDEAM